MNAAAEDDCVCRRCKLQRLAGDVAARSWSLPHQDLSEMVILRHFDARAYLDGATAPLAAVQVRPGGDRGRAFLRALLGDVQAELATSGRLDLLTARFCFLLDVQWARPRRGVA